MTTERTLTFVTTMQYYPGLRRSLVILVSHEDVE